MRKLLYLSILFICFAYNDVLSQSWVSNGICDLVDGQQYSNGNTTGCACTWYSIDILSGDTTLNCAFGNCGQSYLEECAFDCNGHGGAPTLSVARTCDATAVPVCWFQGGGSAGELFCGSIALPIEMGDFWGESTTEGNVLYWTTITELDNDYFNLSYSQDGIDFIVLTQIKGAGSSQSPKNYRFIHTSPLVGVGYYKITQFDYNGESEEFPIIAINRLIKGILFSDIFPNPSTNVFFFNYNGKMFNTPINVKIESSLGVIIMEGEIDKYNNSQSISFDLNGVNKGIYLVKITQGNNSETKRLLLH